MPRHPLPLGLLLVVLLGFAAGPARAEEAFEGGQLFDRTLERLVTMLPSQREELRAAAPEWRARARAATSLAAERDVVFAFLARLPASHVALLSGYAHRAIEADLRERSRVGLGLEVVGLDDGHYVGGVLAGSPAADAGVRRGDRVLAIDGVPTARSQRLEYRTDDAYLPDPPSHLVRCEAGVPVALTLRRAPDAEPFDVLLRPASFCLIDLDRAAARIVSRGGARIGVLPITYMYLRRTGRLVGEALRGPLADADAIVLDVRGHGGSPRAVWQVLQVLRRLSEAGVQPVILLVDARTRSAKEMLLQRAQASGYAVLVGEHSAGAVRPCRFLAVGQDTWLMCPVQDLDESWALELVGLAPDVPAADRLRYAAGADPILEAGLLVALERLATADLR